jgi:hypothetical protein
MPSHLNGSNSSAFNNIARGGGGGGSWSGSIRAAAGGSGGGTTSNSTAPAEPIVKEILVDEVQIIHLILTNIQEHLAEVELRLNGGNGASSGWTAASSTIGYGGIGRLIDIDGFTSLLCWQRWHFK